MKAQVIKFEIFHMPGPPTVPSVLTPQNKEWSGVVRKLVDLRVDQWDAEYCAPFTMDGSEWSLTIRSSELSIRCKGSNAYPPNFDEVQEVIESAAASSSCQDQTYKRKPKKCPNCGAAPVASILYGIPSISAELLAKEERGEVVFGGCVIEVDGSQPHWKCSNCRTEFYKAT